MPLRVSGDLYRRARDGAEVAIGCQSATISALTADGVVGTQTWAALG